MVTFYYQVAMLVLIVIGVLLFIFRSYYKKSKVFRVVTYVYIGIWSCILILIAYDLFKQAVCNFYRTLEVGYYQMIPSPF